MSALIYGRAIRFTKRIDEGPSEDSPGGVFAEVGELGIFVEDKPGDFLAAQKWRYVVKTVTGKATFRASLDEFEVLP